MAFENFKNGHKEYTSKRTESDDLSAGQSPDTLMISCSDSRVDVNLLTGSKPGEIFSIENVAAMVPPYDEDDSHSGTAAAIEYAVKALEVKNIVIMGHSNCGGCGALCHIEDYREKYEFIAPWMDNAANAIEKVKHLPEGTDPEVKREALEHAVVLESINNLMTYSFIRDAVKENKLKIHGWHFDIKTGNILEHDKTSGKFLDIHRGESHPNENNKKSKFTPE